MKKFFWIILYLALSQGVPLSAQITRYVTDTGSGVRNGSSWSNASSDLQAMIDASSEGDFVYVAAGIYRPYTPAFGQPYSRDNSFHIVRNAKVYGGDQRA